MAHRYALEVIKWECEYAVVIDRRGRSTRFVREYGTK
jgi:hypothetical protein